MSVPMAVPVHWRSVPAPTQRRTRRVSADNGGVGHFMPRRLCSRWLEGGWCWKAETCTFAHGHHELHPDVLGAVAPMQPMVYPRGAAAQPVGTAKGFRFSAGAAPFAPAARVSSALRPETAHVEAQALPAKPGAIAFNPDAPAFELPASALDATNNRSFKLNADAAPFELRPAIDAEDCGGEGFKFNADATPFEVAVAPAAGPLGSTSMSNAVTASGSAPSAASSSEPGAAAEAAAEPEEAASGAELAVEKRSPRPATSLPGVMPRQAPAEPPRAAPAPRPAALQSPEPLPSPAAAAALKFIRRNPALVPESPGAKALLHGLVVSPSPLKLPSPGLDLTRDPSVSTLATDLTSPTRSQRASSRVSSVCLELGSPTGAWARSPQLLPAAPPLPSPCACSPVMSPVALSPSKLQIPRALLLQAGTVSRRIECGPPGLAHCAPTPTSTARIIGFVHPQPGLIRTTSVPTHTSTHH
mmetsp:Transcript_105588/g.330196  ORF Transcript_105588/g.330196 Transcript_105588/m.330196 type:complete len:472 (+) Transcript_105588:1-1416(+)